MSSQRQAAPGLLDESVTIPPGVVYREFVQETIVLNLDTGQYHGLNATGAKIMRALETARSVRAAAELLAVEFPTAGDRLIHDVAAFCRDLERRGLVVIGD